MSKIVLLFFAPDTYVEPCYYSQLAEEFKKFNHNILAVNTFKNKNDTISSPICPKIEDRIINFKPNLIISFNNVSSEKIYQDTNCPIFILESDFYDYFPNKELIKKYQDKIYIGIFSKYRFKLWYKTLSFLPREKFVYFKNSTSLTTSSGQVQNINISIIATVLGLNPKNAVVQSLVRNYGNFEATAKTAHIIKKAYRDLNLVDTQDYAFLNSSAIDLFHYISYLKRPYLLNNLADLGLTVSGKFYDLKHIFSGLPDFALCLNPEEVITKQANEDFYNRSKISINAHFAHNIDNEEVSGYSWRVCDIMATNACLVSTNCRAIKEDFGKWVDIPMFSDRHSVYELCKKLLEDDQWRSDISLRSQAAIIEGKYRFSDRIEEMEEIFNLKQKISSDKSGYCEFLLPTKFISESKAIINHKTTADPKPIELTKNNDDDISSASSIKNSIITLLFSKIFESSEEAKIFKDWSAINQHHFLSPPIKQGSKLKTWYRKRRREKKILKRWRKSR